MPTKTKPCALPCASALALTRDALNALLAHVHAGIDEPFPSDATRAAHLHCQGGSRTAECQRSAWEHLLRAIHALEGSEEA